MGEVGCLKDGSYQNLQVEGSTEFDVVTGKSYVTHSGGIQRLTTDAALVVASTTDLVLFAHIGGSSRVITLPPATIGRHIKFLWEVSQDTSDRVLTCQGTDDMTGMIYTTVGGDAAGDGDVVEVTAGTVAITFVDDIAQGSCVDLYWGVVGTWIVVGQLVLAAVGEVPTLA